MEHIREYLLSVTAAAIICGVIRCFTGDRGIIPMLCGVFLLVTVIRPMMEFSVANIPWSDRDLMKNAESVASDGTDYARAAMSRRIKEQCEAYILDKAESFGYSIRVSFSLNEDFTPAGCTVNGRLSSYAREQISGILESELGIPREEQRWIP